MKAKEELLYTREHIWLSASQDSALIGITDFAQKSLGELVFVDLPDVDDVILVGETFGTAESVKTVSDLFMPVDGTVIAVNEEAVQDPEIVNQDAYAAWLLKIAITDQSQLSELMSAEEYNVFVNGDK